MGEPVGVCVCAQRCVCVYASVCMCVRGVWGSVCAYMSVCIRVHTCACVWSTTVTRSCEREPRLDAIFPLLFVQEREVIVNGPGKINNPAVSMANAQTLTAQDKRAADD